MTEYTPIDPAHARAVYRTTLASDEQYRRLEHAAAPELQRALFDPAEPIEARGNALMLLLVRRDSDLQEVLPRLFEEPELCRAAIRHASLANPRTMARLQSLLDDPDGRVWPEAALALARHKDASLRPRLLAWFRDGDEGHRNVAVQGLMALDADQAKDLLRESYEAGGRGEDDRLTLAVFLLALGDGRGLPLIEAVARRAEGPEAVSAATSLAGHDPVQGARLMLWILDHGDLAAKQALVEHAWNRDQLPHAFTADAIHETRVWAEQQLERALRP